MRRDELVGVVSVAWQHAEDCVEQKDQWSSLLGCA